MRKSLVLLLLMLLTAPVFAVPLSICDYFTGKSGCFLLYDRNQHNLLTQYNPARCAEKLPRPSDWSGTSPSLSADEQLAVMKTKEALRDSKIHNYLETSPQGWKLYGRTGTGKSQGWFVGFIEKGKQSYAFVLNFSDLQDPKTSQPAGLRAEAITKALLTKMNLF